MFHFKSLYNNPNFYLIKIYYQIKLTIIYKFNKFIKFLPRLLLNFFLQSLIINIYLFSNKF